ncbi:PfkB family carbohydrate kinase [Methanolobus tindarius]|uniref:PfkB family carbohydrate kinase n=1 Tax=Methanolobus tindarius TaxID=2221 RepID=UPI0024802023|nr:PfkB family carbohydrate kinase [Methanolobus tindarius]
MASCPGGAMLNSSITLGRLKIPVSFISEFGQDKVGSLIKEFLSENGVATKHLFLYNGKSPLSLAFLNDRNDAKYEFYEDFPKKRLDIEMPQFEPDDILIFGSIMALKSEIRKELKNIIITAKSNGTTLFYDPNFRDSLSSSLADIRPLISENIKFADIVRASNEDMKKIGDCNNPDEAYDFVCERGCDILIYTENSHGVYLKTPSYSKHYTAPEIETVSTVGAGDTFNAGIAYMLHKRKVTDLYAISETEWDEIIETAIEFASHVCMSADNYITPEFADRLKKIY